MTAAVAARAGGRMGGRVGGIAVALGVGAAIASAAPAWASPDDGPGASAQTSTVDSAGDNRLTPRTGQAAKRSLPKVTSGGSPSTDRPGATAVPPTAQLVTAATARSTSSKPVPTPRLQTSASPTEAVETALPTTTRNQARPLALGRSAVTSADVSAQANPIHDLLSTFFPWFDPRGQRIFVPKGWHYSLPPQYAFFVTKVSGHATFTEDSAYDVKNVDQYDWLKLTGVTFTPWRPDTDAIMVAWRYNLDTEMFEIGPYYNSDLARIMPTADEIISVPAGQEFDFSLDYNGITLTYGDQTVYKARPDDLQPNFWTAVRINGWFGGTSVAPRTVSYYLHLNCF